MKAAVVLPVVVGAGALLLMAMTRQTGQIEAGEGDIAFDAGALSDSAEALMNQLTEEAAIVDNTTAGRNLAAFQAMTGLSEGTEGRGGYRACFGYKHTIQDMRDHPAITGEWRGEVLSDTMCANAGFGPGCVSTAAGRYQITKPTWRDFGGAARHGAFDEAGQDSCFADIVNHHGAMQDILAGRVMAAVGKLRTRWASFPGNKAKQGQRTPEKLVAWFQQQGGVLA